MTHSEKFLLLGTGGALLYAFLTRKTTAEVSGGEVTGLSYSGKYKDLNPEYKAGTDLPLGAFGAAAALGNLGAGGDHPTEIPVLGSVLADSDWRRDGLAASQDASTWAMSRFG